MARFDTTFSPYVSAIIKPDGENVVQAASSGVLDYFKLRDQKKEKEIEMQDRDALRRDNKRLALFGAADTTLGAFSRENGSFETAEGISAAHKIRMERAKQRLNEFKATHPKGSGRGASSAQSSVTSAPSFNPAAFSAPVKPTETKTPTKTVTVYKDGKPVTYTVGG